MKPAWLLLPVLLAGTPALAVPPHFFDLRNLTPRTPGAPPGMVRYELCLINTTDSLVRGAFTRPNSGNAPFNVAPHSRWCNVSHRRLEESLVARAEAWRDGGWHPICERRGVTTAYGYLIVRRVGDAFVCDGP